MIKVTEIDPGGSAAEELVLEVIRSGQLASGPMVERLETGFRDLTGAKHALAVNSGTTALVAAIAGLGLGPGDEVVTSPFTFVATVNAILEAGATVRFADIGADFNVDPGEVRAAIGPLTKAVMPVHLYGQCADMAAICDVAAEHELPIVEDAAQAHGATFDGQPAGSFGVACFSLYATKNMTTGEGGVVTTNDDSIADRIAVLRNQGMRARYQYELAGHNWRLTDLQAALGVAQLPNLAAKTEARRSNAQWLSQHLDGIDGLMLPCTFEGRSHVWHQYTVRVLPRAKLSRDDLGAALTRAGIGTGIYYPKVVFDYDCYRSHDRVIVDDVPNAFAAAEQVLSLPVHPNLTEADLAHISTTLRSLLE